MSVENWTLRRRYKQFLESWIFLRQIVEFSHPISSENLQKRLKTKGTGNDGLKIETNWITALEYCMEAALAFFLDKQVRTQVIKQAMT